MSAHHAALTALTNRIHAKRHAGWNCEDMHPAVHAQHMAGFRKKAQLILQARQHNAA